MALNYLRLRSGVFLIINYEDMKIESFGEKTNEII